MLCADKITANAMQSLISTMAIPFIDFGHTTYIPDEMKKHMNKDVMQALTPSVRYHTLAIGMYLIYTFSAPQIQSKSTILAVSLRGC